MDQTLSDYADSGSCPGKECAEIMGGTWLLLTRAQYPCGGQDHGDRIIIKPAEQEEGRHGNRGYATGQTVETIDQVDGVDHADHGKHGKGDPHPGRQEDIAKTERPATNLVFLLDVSGSMNSQDKLPLLVDSMKILLKELNVFIKRRLLRHIFYNTT